MAYKIVAKKRFVLKLEKILSYLEQEWGGKVSGNFLDKVDKRIESLKHHPYIGAPSHIIRNARGILVTKHNRLFYKIEGKTIILLDIYDTRMKTYK